MILRPSWKLLNFHLPIFTEILGYKKTIQELRSDQDQQEDPYVRGYESDNEDDSYDVEGMTLQLIELLTTLVSR